MVVGGLALGWQRPRSSAEEPEATDNGAYLCQDVSTPTHVTSKPPGRTRWGNCTSCPEEGELAPDGGAGSPSPLTPVTERPPQTFRTVSWCSGAGIRVQRQLFERQR